jgi:hypothetical protein
MRLVQVLSLWVAGILLAVVLAMVVTSVLGAKWARDRYASESQDLLQRGRAAPSRTVEPAVVAALPPPVRAFVESSGVVGKPVPKVLLLTHTGELRASAGAPWMPFTSEQAYALSPPGFLWLARAEVGPLVSMWARDKFVDARGNMLIQLLGMLTVADTVGPEMDQGAGLRHWGEILALPEAALSPELTWTPVDDRSARFVAAQGTLRMEATLHFGEDGRPDACQANRYRDVAGKPVLTPWSGRSRAWKPFRGRMFPTLWESTWHLPEGDLTAVRMEVTDVRAE